MAKKSYVPQSKAYEVLDRLTEKGFVEQVITERPKKYKAIALDKVMSRVILREEKFLRRLNNNFESLQKVVEVISSLYEKFGAFRLFHQLFSEGKKHGFELGNRE